MPVLQWQVVKRARVRSVTRCSVRHFAEVKQSVRRRVLCAAAKRDKEATT